MKLDGFLQRLAEGDRSAFKPIYDSTNKAVYFTALSILGERSLAEDAVQSAYLSVIKNAASYRTGNKRSRVDSARRTQYRRQYAQQAQARDMR